MAVSSPPPLPDLVSFSDCWACGERVGWVEFANGYRQPVDPECDLHGPIALLRDGRSAVNLRPDRPTREHEWLDDHHKGPRFWNHNKTCPASGVRSIGWSATRIGNRPDPSREARRQAGVDADQLRDSGIDPTAQ